MHGRIIDVVADVLNEHDVERARTLLAAALLTDTDTEMATRVGVRADRPDATLRIHGHGFRPAVWQLPCAADVREHPLYRYRYETGDTRPTRLTDATRAGWTVGERTRRIFEALQISEHQMELAVSSAGEYEGWALLASSPITLRQLQPLAEHAALIRGLDSHVELLAQVRSWSPCGADPRRVPLTPREQIVLQLVFAGHTATAIGARLGISPRTVHKHQENLYRKLGARDRLGAVLIAQRAGLLPVPADPEEAGAVDHRGRIYAPAAAQSSTPASSATVSTSNCASVR